MKILGIDPSVKDIGIALHDTETKGTRTKTIKPSKKLGDTKVLLGCEIVMMINAFLQKGESIQKVVIEYPQWENSQRGSIAAQKGYTLDLAFLVGYISASLKLSPFDILTPTVAQWKGQTPKAATELRVKKAFGLPDGLTDHEYDAAGLILWFLF